MKATRRRSHRTMASAKLSLSKMVSDVKDPAAIIGGLVAGKIIGDMLDKAVSTTATVAGLRGISSVKELLKPAILVGAGLAAKQLLKNPILKNVGIGVAAYGGAVAVNSIVSIPQLSTFGANTAASNNQKPPVAGLGLLPRATFHPTSVSHLQSVNNDPSGVIL